MCLWLQNPKPIYYNIACAAAASLIDQRLTCGWNAWRTRSPDFRPRIIHLRHADLQRFCCRLQSAKHLQTQTAEPGLTVRDVIPKLQPLALAEFATLRARLLRIAARTQRPQPACASPSPLPAPRPICSAASLAACNPQDRDHRGACPEQPNPSNLQRRPRNTENRAQLRSTRIAVAQGIPRGVDS